MRWKQFFTPVKSVGADDARALVEGSAPSRITILDVRQPGEYRSGHIPGAKLIPIADLNDRLTELDRGKPVLVYCAIGGRSRVAAQMLAGKGFDEVINLTGGFKAWSGGRAFHAETQGLEIFPEQAGALETLKLAYGLEEGLRAFYLSLAGQAGHEAVRRLFTKLAEIEMRHKDRLWEQARHLVEAPVERRDFEADIAHAALEGGLTSEEYLQLFGADSAVPAEVVELAMSIEAQAMDLYLRAAERAVDAGSRRFLQGMAEEEQAHLRLLGDLIETFGGERS